MEHRKEKKSALTERAAKANIKKLSDLRSKGQDPRAVIDQTIASGWKGLFEVHSGKNAPNFAAAGKLPPSYIPASERILQERAVQVGAAR